MLGSIQDLSVDAFFQEPTAYQSLKMIRVYATEVLDFVVVSYRMGNT
jgi:hypothetical protein